MSATNCCTHTHTWIHTQMSHTPPTDTHTRIHTIIWHMPLQNIDSSANKERGRAGRELQERGNCWLNVRTSCFKSQGTYLPPPSHMRGTYLTLSVHLHMHLCLQAFNISVLGQLSTRAVWEVSKYCRDRYEDCYIIALLMMTGTKYYHCSAYTIPVYLEVEGDK